MGRPSRLTTEAIVDAAELLFVAGSDDFSLRELGENLGVHGTAIYRHFRDKADLLRAVADRSLCGVATAGDAEQDPVAAMGVMLKTLRATLIARPAAARVLSSGPTRQPNELALTERFLALLIEAGLPPRNAVAAYHALIEYTVGSAIIDMPLARMEQTERIELYRRWRSDYLGLDPELFPLLTELAPFMYRDAGSQFSHGLDAMLRDLVGQHGTQS